MKIDFPADQIVVKKLTNRTFKVEMWVNEDEAIKMGKLIAIPDDYKTCVTIDIDEEH